MRLAIFPDIIDIIIHISHLQQINLKKFRKHTSENYFLFLLHNVIARKKNTHFFFSV